MYLGLWENTLPNLVGSGYDQAAEKNNILPISSWGHVGRFIPFLFNLSSSRAPFISTSESPPVSNYSTCSTLYTGYLTCIWVFLLYLLFMQWGSVNKAGTSRACIWSNSLTFAVEDHKNAGVLLPRSVCYSTRSQSLTHVLNSLPSVPVLPNNKSHNFQLRIQWLFLL